MYLQKEIYVIFKHVFIKTVENISAIKCFEVLNNDIRLNVMLKHSDWPILKSYN